MVGANTSRAHMLPRVRRVRRVVAGGEVAVTLIDVVFWVALTAVATGVILRARRSARPTLAGAGDDKPPGYENPTPHDLAMRESGPAS